jgi:serine phosphatase RsbU (regulator of sigma subunit)
MNAMLERKNRDITDSIQYAQRIQNSVLQEPTLLQKLIPNSFLLFLPKDIISGDFYWWADLVDAYVLAVADCTGHGVPGAFMSLLGANLLNKVVKEYGITEPSAILQSLNTQLQHTFNQNNTFEQSLDGMDIAICTIEKQNQVLYFAGARRPLLCIRNQEISILEGTKISIGELLPNPPPFKTVSLQLQKGDSYYLFSDGFADQYGGPDNKKFTFRRLKELFARISDLPMAQQKERLLNEFENWKQDCEQTDDIAVLGFKIE